MPYYCTISLSAADLVSSYPVLKISDKPEDIYLSNLGMHPPFSPGWIVIEPDQTFFQVISLLARINELGIEWRINVDPARL